MTSRASSSTQTLRLGTQTVSVVIEPDALTRLPQILETCDVDAVVLVVDEPVWSVHAQTVTGLLDARATAVSPISAGQEATTLGTAGAVAERAAGLVGRRPCVVGFGGGTVLKLAGAVAHLLDWGSPLMLVPTTLLAMVDAAPSARHALAIGHRAGALGVLHAPAAILCDPCLLATLPEVGWREGMVEVLKAALALGSRDTEDLVLATAQLPRVQASAEGVGRFIEQAIALKAQVLADDPVERTVGLALHYGHTFSRALEAVAGPRVRHGLAVAAGMLMAGRVAERLGLLSAPEREAHHALIRQVVGDQAGPKVRALVDFANGRGFLGMLLDDPKRRLVAGDAIPLVLLEQLGRVHYPAGSPAPVTAVPPSTVAAALTAEATERR